jgi:hypothetical protein
MAKTEKDETPYIAVDLMTNENLTRHATMIAGYDAYRGKRPVEVFYRPRKRKAKRKEFPYNG